MAGPMSRRWCVTVFVQNVEEFVPSSLFPSNRVDYACWGFETCPDTARLHWHLYLRMKSRSRMETIKRFLGRDDAHCEIAAGTEQQCKEYVYKDGNNVGEFGEYKADEGKQGKRSDLEEIAEKIKNGATMREVAESHPSDYIRYHGGIAAYASAIVNPPAQRDISVIWLWGPTGTGKSHRVRTKFEDLYIVSPGRSPWDGYTGQSAVLFDEFTGEKNWTVDFMKQALDRWKLLLDARYNNKYAAWSTVVICSNNNPASFYSNESGPDLEAFRRRINNSCRLITLREDLGGPSYDQVLLEPPNPLL